MPNSKHISNVMTFCTWKKGKVHLPTIFYLHESIYTLSTDFNMNIIRFSKAMSIIGRLGL